MNIKYLRGNSAVLNSKQQGLLADIILMNIELRNNLYTASCDPTIRGSVCKDGYKEIDRVLKLKTKPL